MTRVAFDFPFGGLSEVYGFTNQEPSTTRDERNMRSVDPVTGRMRGAQRAGLGLHAGGAQANGSNKIKALASFSKSKGQVSWTENAGNNDWSTKLTPTAAVVEIVRDDYGGYYAATSLNYIIKFNADGEVVHNIAVPMDSDSKINGIAVDQYQSIIVATGPSDHTASPAPAAILYGYELQADDTYAVAWEIESPSIWSYTAVCVYPGAVKDTLYVCSSEQPSLSAQTNVFLNVFPDFEMKFAPVEDTAKRCTQAVGATGLTGAINRLMQVNAHPQGQAYFSVTDQVGTDAKYQAVFRADPNGSSPSTATRKIENNGSADNSGIGMAVAIGPTQSDSDVILFTAGDTFGSNTTSRHIVALRDDGSSANLLYDDYISVSDPSASPADSNPGWQITGVSDNRRVRIAVDKDDNIYVPYGITNAASLYNGDPIIFAEYTSGAFVDAEVKGVNGTATQPVLAAALPIGKPTFNNDDIKTSEFAIYGGQPVSLASLWRTRMANVTQTVAAPREVRVAAVSGNKLRVLNTSGAWADPTSNTLVASDAPYVQMASAFGKLYIVDGQNNLVWDPDDGTNGTLGYWNSNDLAPIPRRCRLVEVWRGRVVLARDLEDPSAWHMSEVFDPQGWNNFPQNATASAAISASNSRAGGVPDIVNTIIPYNDDLLLFGGDSSIYQMTGDPRAGGQIDLITDSTGISFGRPWCKDPSGRLWFFGSHGDLYVMQPGMLPTSVSASKIPRALQQVDLGSYYVNLVWNYIDHGVHIFVCPYGAGGTLVDHYFYDERQKAFHKDRFGVANSDNIQPTAAIDLNGDTFDDRAVLIGGEDGRLRRWGKDSNGNLPSSDQQTTSADLAIDSYFTTGPLGSPATTAQLQLTDLTALLGESQDGCNFEVFSSDNPEELGVAKATGSFRPGRNGRKLVRVSGDNVFVRLRNATAGSRWAYEKGYAEVGSAGDLRRGS